MAFQNQRLFLICCGSAVANGLLWFGLSRGANQVASVASLPELVVDRVTVEKQDPNRPEKLVMRAVVPKPPPKPVPTAAPEKREPVRHDMPPPPPEAGAHNRVLTAPANPAAPKSSSFTALPDGNAKLGDPTSGQNAGNNTANPVNPQPTAPHVQPPPAPVHTDPALVSPPPAAPVKEAAPPPPPPPPAPKPKPSGPTQDAAPSHQVNLEIPDSLKSQTFKSFVRVKVEISSDGSFVVTLRTSSGNTDIDKLVLDALNKWKWKPALKDGEAVDSVQLFRFNFVVD